MKKISTIFTLSALLGASLFAKDNFVLDFEKKRISQNPNVKLKEIKINTKKEIAIAGWNGYIFDVDANIQGKNVKVKDILFSNGTHIAFDLFDAKTQMTSKIDNVRL